MTLSAPGAFVTNCILNVLPCAYKRVASEVGVSAVIKPLAVPPAVVVGVEHVIELVGGVCAFAPVEPTLANAYTAAAVILRSPNEGAKDDLKTDFMKLTCQPIGTTRVRQI